jgi:hypothetical protein
VGGSVGAGAPGSIAAGASVAGAAAGAQAASIKLRITSKLSIKKFLRIPLLLTKIGLKLC